MGRMMEHDTITRDQRSALAKLAPLLQDGFYLVGGVALAAHFRTGHRVISICLRREIPRRCSRTSIICRA